MSISNLIFISHEGQRIDQYLTKEFTYSRNFWERVIERGGVRVMQDATWKMQDENKRDPSLCSEGPMNNTQHNESVGTEFVPSKSGKLIKKSYILKDGDTILIDEVERYLDGGILAESPKIDLDIRLEKKDYLVLYKPKGVLSHPNSVRDVASPNIVGGLYHHFKHLPSTANFIRAGLLHRLDKETDGFMIIAKTEEGLAYFKELFQQKSGALTIGEKEAVPLKKYYRAICDFTLEGARFLENIKEYPYYLESFIHPKVPYPGEPKWGITKILDVTHDTGNKKHICIQLEILTGRTHQIRYQLSDIGLPIVGDYLYNEKNITNDEMQLTAWKLEFIDNEGKLIIVQSNDLSI